ncbi:MAG TPA: hypothetical protein VNM39_10850 [Verrucomicrobiae bacterium]|nr:hypothetical protein [Verrucomicrobiae bacterium]
MKQPLPRKPTELERLRAERDLLRAECRLSRLLDNDRHETQMEHDENVLALEAARAAVDAFDKEG